uniref:Pecanex-like protein n=1 Tax=Schistosoma curassoni TaxID=6186 RepID=A0A183JGS1_9TREM
LKVSRKFSLFHKVHSVIIINNVKYVFISVLWIDSWIEVTPQSLGYNQNGSSYSGIHVLSINSQTLGSQEPGGLHTIVEERLLSLFLSEAQEHSDRASDGSLPSPLSHDELHSGDTSEQSHSTYQNISMTKFPTASFPTDFPVTSSGEWASRPEIGAYTALACQTNDSKESVSSPPNCSSPINGSWYLRNSAFMKSRFIGWLLDHIPNILSHATTFLLGAIT